MQTVRELDEISGLVPVELQEAVMRHSDNYRERVTELRRRRTAKGHGHHHAGKKTKQLSRYEGSYGRIPAMIAVLG